MNVYFRPPSFWVWMLSHKTNLDRLLVGTNMITKKHFTTLDNNSLVLRRNLIFTQIIEYLGYVLHKGNTPK